MRSRQATAVQAPTQAEVEGGDAAQVEPEAGQDEETQRRQAEADGAERVGDAAQDDLDGILHAHALSRGGNRQIQQFVGRLVHREPQPLVAGVGQQHGPEDRNEQNQRAADAERQREHENGRDQTPNARRRRPVTKIWTRKLKIPIVTLKVPKNSVSASALPPNRRSATRLS